MNGFRMQFRFLVLFAIFVLLIAQLLPANWPQWRGPDSNGSTSAARDLVIRLKTSAGALNCQAGAQLHP